MFHDIPLPSLAALPDAAAALLYGLDPLPRGRLCSEAVYSGISPTLASKYEYKLNTYELCWT